ncbi:Nn.00g012750.m01.CDS01 [Neocucurbitaria sp. VM-36]
MALLESPNSFKISPNVPSSLSLAPSEFLASRPHITQLMAGTLVFRRDRHSSNPQLETLLVKRAKSDSYAQKWERPAGCLSILDSMVLSCAVRELMEETGLHASYIHCPVGLSKTPEASLDGWGIDPQDEGAELEAGDESLMVSFQESGKRWGVLTVIVDVEEDLCEMDQHGGSVIKVDPEEHEEWIWMTEEQVRSGKDKIGRTIEYTSEAVWRTVLEGFRIREMIEASLPLSL